MAARAHAGKCRTHCQYDGVRQHDLPQSSLKSVAAGISLSDVLEGLGTHPTRTVPAVHCRLSNANIWTGYHVTDSFGCYEWPAGVLGA